MAEIEKRAIKRAYFRNNGNVTKTAKELDVSKQTVYNRARAYGWLDSGGHIDPNLVRDGRLCRDYDLPPEFRDTPGNRAKREQRKRKSWADPGMQELTRRDMIALQNGDAERDRAYEVLCMG